VDCMYLGDNYVLFIYVTVDLYPFVSSNRRATNWRHDTLQDTCIVDGNKWIQLVSGNICPSVNAALAYRLEASSTQFVSPRVSAVYDMPYTSAIFLADLPTMSDRRDKLAMSENYSNPQSSLHSSPPREHPSVTRLRVPSKFPRIPPVPKIPILLLTYSLPLSDFIGLIVFSVYLLFSVFVFCNFVQPLAITFNKRYTLAFFRYLLLVHACV